VALIDFLLKYGRLKRIPRTGWLLRGVSLGDVESVAEHTLGTALISMITARLLHSRGVKVDAWKVVEMAILHDLAESLILDMDREAVKEIGDEKKKAMEYAAEKIVLEGLPGELKAEYGRLLDELHEGESLESRIVKASDKLETAIQAIEYSCKYSSDVLGVFYEDINEVEDFSLNELSELIVQVKKRSGGRRTS